MPHDRIADAGELLAAVTELRVNNAVGRLKKGKNKHRRKTDEQKKTSGKTVRRLALAAVLMLACGLVYLQRETVLPFVEPYTGVLVDERGVMVDQRDRAVSLTLGWWESIAPYFAWKAADVSETRLLRCRREGRPDCDVKLAIPPAGGALAGNASATTQ